MFDLGDPWAALDDGGEADVQHCALPDKATGAYGPNCTKVPCPGPRLLLQPGLQTMVQDQRVFPPLGGSFVTQRVPWQWQARGTEVGSLFTLDAAFASVGSRHALVELVMRGTGAQLWRACGGSGTSPRRRFCTSARTARCRCTPHVTAGAPRTRQARTAGTIITTRPASTARPPDAFARPAWRYVVGPASAPTAL